MTKNKSKQTRRKQSSKPKTKVKEIVVYRDRPQSIGAQLGNGLQNVAVSLFKRITGLGDYKLSPNISDIKNNSMLNKFANNAPKFSSTGGSFVFEHCEYIGEVVSSTGFSTQLFPITPTNPSTFPWLSALSGQFESYQFEGLIFRYQSTSGDATGSNTALGSVMGYVAYDDRDLVPANKAVLLQYDGCVSAKPAESFLIGAECDPSRLVMERLYTGTPPSGTDPRFYNFGNFVIATNGNQTSGNSLGELWVHYKIRFFTAKEGGRTSGDEGPYCNFASLYSGTASANPFLNASVTYTYNIQATFTNTTITWNTVPDGIYLLYLSYSGTSATTISPTYNVTGGTITFPPGTSYNYLSAGWGGANTVTAAYIMITASPSSSNVSSITVNPTGGTYPSLPTMNGYIVKLN